MTDVITGASIQINPGIQQANFTTAHINIGWSNVTGIMLVFPPGCSGLVGARISYARNPVYPIGNTGWFILDDYVLQIPITTQQQGGQWGVDVYNTDTYAHTIQAYFSWNYVNLAQSGAASPLISL